MIQTNDFTWQRGKTARLVMTLGAGFSDVRLRVFSTVGSQGPVGNTLAFAATLDDDEMEIPDAPSGTVAFTASADQTLLLTPNSSRGEPRNLYRVEVQSNGVWTTRLQGTVSANGGAIPVTADGGLHDGVVDYYANHPDG
jgi:hypothetical protein